MRSNPVMNTSKALVLGAGVSGLTSAYELLKAGYNVTIWSRERKDEQPATSANAYAFWLPVRSDTDKRVERWANKTYSAFKRLSRRSNSGVVMRQVFEMKTSVVDPWYGDKL